VTTHNNIPRVSLPSAYIELRGSSGRLYGMLDVARLIIEFKHSGARPEQIDLAPYFKVATVKKEEYQER
jgi:hypothetical protein